MTRAAIVDYDDYDTFSKLPPLRLRMTTCVSTANCDAGDQNVDGAIGLPATSTSETSSLRKVPIYSDNGSNFRGAETDVVHALKTWDQERIGRELLRRDIQWYFNPPAASHQGGVWERLIRSVRKILHAMIGEHLVNEETLVTFLVEVEKILNSRPITRVSSDPSDLEPLTPNHILLLRHNPCSAPSEFEDSDKFQARWKRVHILANEFWARWVKEYLPMLQERQKWLKRRRNFKVGDLVIMKDTNIPRGQWPKALVQETLPDSDGVVRQVLVRSETGVLRRDVRKLCLLEEELLKSIEESMEKDET